MHATDCTALTVAGLTLDLAGRRILSDVSFTVRAGEFLGLIGPNGGGKTTLLRTLLRLLPPTQGSIAWADRACGRPRIGYVPQRVGVDAHFPLAAGELVRQGVGGSRPLLGKGRKEARHRSEELLARVGLGRQAATAAEEVDERGVAHRSIPSQSSETVVSSAFAMRATLRIVGLRLPFSIPLM